MQFRNKNTVFIIFSLLCLSILLSSCDTSKYLAEGESYTRENRIILKSDEKIKNKPLLKEELSLLYKQKQSNNWFGLWIYYNIQEAGDTLWYHNVARRFLAEKPSIFNENLVRIASDEMEDFLRNKRGFYKADVDYRLYKEGEYGTGVDYMIDCGKRYHINSVTYNASDTAIQEIIQKEQHASFLRKGEPVNEMDYELEKNRITSLLQNHGYAQFYSNYIELTGDSLDYKIDLSINIYNPVSGEVHKTYKNGSIKIYSDYHPNQVFSKLDIDTINDIIFHKELPEYLVKPSLIFSMIEIEPGKQTTKKSKNETYNRLSLLNPYKFIAIKQKVDSLTSDQINYDILLIPETSIWDLDYGVQLNYTTFSKFNQLLGLGLNFSMVNQNLFGGAERFVMNFNADTDIGIITIKPQEFYLQNSYNIFLPKPTKLYQYSLIRPIIRLFGKEQFQNFKNYASTKITVGANFESLANTISIITANASIGYQFKTGDRESLHLNQISLDYYYPTILNDTLFPGNFYLNSLSKRITTGFLFKDIAYSYSSATLFSRFSWQFNSGLELSGHEVYLANKAYNLITKKESIWQVDKDDNFKFAKYGKTYLELRTQYKTGVFNKFASRLFFGVGIPYSDNSVLPYTKQFFVGGPQSIRGWEKRGLGPGGFYDPIQAEDEIAYQKGDIKMEANLEYRFDLPWYFEGATFVDMGNIWTFNDDPNIENENFSSDFYKEIAIAGGFGVRLNFNFLLLRLDLGYKLRTPYLHPDTNKHWQIKHIQPFNDAYLTFGLDYPF